MDFPTRNQVKQSLVLSLLRWQLLCFLFAFTMLGYAVWQISPDYFWDAIVTLNPELFANAFFAKGLGMASTFGAIAWMMTAFFDAKKNKKYL